jgi:predicted deacetylase
MTARFAIAIHDVAPSWLPEAQEWRSLIAERTTAPVALLVVPRFRLIDTWDGENLEWLQQQVAAGDEPVLHGYTHTTPDHDDEREFRGISALEARGRVLAGLAALRTVGVYPRGFIAPCYNGACDRWFESERSGIAWWATRLDLRTRSRVMTAPAIGLGASTLTRRRMTPAAAQWGLRLAQRHHRYRIDLHPADLRHDRLRATGLELIDRALDAGDELSTHEMLLDPACADAEASSVVAGAVPR